MKLWINQYRYNNQKKILSIFDIFCAGGIAAVPISIVESPIDLLKCKLQSQVGKGEYKNVFDAGIKIATRYGVRGLYQGFFPTMVRNIPCFGSYFAGYEWAARTLSPGNITTPPLYICIISGGLAGFSFWGIWYPLEVVKTRMQVDDSDPKLRKYRNSIDCATMIYKNEGLSAFWKGYGPSIIRAFFVNAAIFGAFTYVKRQLT